MAIQFTLDDIRTAAEKKYGDVEITCSTGEVCVMRNALRLEPEERKTLADLQDMMGNDSDDAVEMDQAKILAEVIILIAKGDSGHQLVKDANGDLTILSEILSAYREGTQVGEASTSDN